MKKLLYFLFIATCVGAADLKLSDGRTFKDYRVMSQTPTTITIRHAAGGVKIAKNLLPADVLAKYPIDEAKAAAEEEEIAKGKAIYDAKARKTASDEEQAALARKIDAENNRLAIEAARESGRREAELAAAKKDGAKIVTEAEAKRAQRDAINAAVNRQARGEAPIEIVEKLKDAIRDHAEVYFKNDYKAPANQLTLTIKVKVDEPRAVPGYPNRYEVTGLASWDGYVSQGRSFTNDKSWFEATVEIDARGQALVTSFSPRSSAPLRR